MEHLEGNAYNYKRRILMNHAVVYIAGVPVHSTIRIFSRALKCKDEKIRR